MATRSRPAVSIMDQLEAGIEELDEGLQGKRVLRKVPVTVQTPAVYSAEDVRKLRSDLNMSQSEFADLLEVSPKTVQAWEHGLRSPGPIVRHYLDVYSKPDMRDSLRFASPPSRRRKPDGPTGHAKAQKVVAAAPGRTDGTISARVAATGKHGTPRRSTRGASVRKGRDGQPR